MLWAAQYYSFGHTWEYVLWHGREYMPSLHVAINHARAFCSNERSRTRVMRDGECIVTYEPHVVEIVHVTESMED